MDIDKRMEDYFRQGLAQGINTHVIEVSTTVDGKIFLRMQPIQVPTQEQLNRIMPPEVSQWARQQAERDVEIFAQQQQSPQSPRANMVTDFNDMRSFMNVPKIAKKPEAEFESETIESYKSPLAGME
jgi:hypothetical protein